MKRAAMQKAGEYGVTVVLDDLGDWGRDELRSEYDPSGPTIRINARVADPLEGEERDVFVATAIWHELYHHRERIGEIAREPDPTQRERDARAYARHFAKQP